MINKWQLPGLSLLCSSPPGSPVRHTAPHTGHHCAASRCHSHHSCPSEDLSSIMAALPLSLLIDCPWLLSCYENHVLGEVSKGLPSVMHVVPSLCPQSQQCWSEPDLRFLGDIVPCWCVSCLLHLQYLIFIGLLALLRAQTWALFFPTQTYFGVLHFHATPCWLMVP